jgi:hypothetical protein
MIETAGLLLVRTLLDISCESDRAHDAHSRLACWSQRALSLMSASLMVPFELAYMNQLQLMG